MKLFLNTSLTISKIYIDVTHAQSSSTCIGKRKENVFRLWSKKILIWVY